MTVSTPSIEIPRQHKAVVYDNPGKVSTKVETVDTPKPTFGQVLVNLTHTGVCHSDLGVMTNSWKVLPYPTQPGQVGGHEGVGTVAQLGPGCESSDVKVGDRVGIKWVASVCGTCLPCLSGSDALCLKGTISGYYTPGTFQQYALAPVDYVTRIPDNLSSADAAPMLCAGVTVNAALKRTRAQAGDFVVISGAGGGLGHLATQLGSRGLGFRIIGVDHGSKEALVKESGAEAFVDMTKFPRDDNGAALAEHVKSLTYGHGAHAVVVCTAANAAYAQAIPMLRFNGVLVCVGVPEGDLLPIATACPAPIIFKQIAIEGSAVGNRRDAIEVLDFAARGVLKIHSRVEKMERLTSVFEEMHRGEVNGRVVLDLS